MFGPRPLNRARPPSVWTMCFRHCQIEIDWTDVERPHCGMARICKEDDGHSHQTWQTDVRRGWWRTGWSCNRAPAQTGSRHAALSAWFLEHIALKKRSGAIAVRTGFPMTVHDRHYSEVITVPILRRVCNKRLKVNTIKIEALTSAATIMAALWPPYQKEIQLARTGKQRSSTRRF